MRPKVHIADVFSAFYFFTTMSTYIHTSYFRTSQKATYGRKLPTYANAKARKYRIRNNSAILPPTKESGVC
jgi:hypothetical protein